MKRILQSVIASLLRVCARKLLRKHSPKIVAITGSVGKTSTKFAIAKVLETTYKVGWHEGNYNSEVGLPLAMFEVEAPSKATSIIQWIRVFAKIAKKLVNWDYSYEILVLELGISEPGEMDHHLQFVKPDIGIVTAVQGAHLDGMGSLDAVFQEKIKVANAAQYALVNIDNTLLLEYAQNTGCHTYNTPTKITRTKTGTLQYLYDDLKISSKLIAPYQLSAQTAAIHVAKRFDVPADSIVDSLETMEPFKGRVVLYKGRNDSQLIDDTYNNVSVLAAKASIANLSDFPGKRKILILGSLNEMGAGSQDGHEEVGAFAAKHVDILITIGDMAEKWLAASAKKNGLKEVVSFKNPVDAGGYVATILKKGDVVLTKGSQNGVYSEEALKKLLKNPRDSITLVRQSTQWLDLKRKQFPSI